MPRSRRWRKLEELRRGVDKGRRASPLRNSGCCTTFSKKGMLVLMPRMRNSRKRAEHLGAAFSKRERPGAHLDQERIVVRRDDGARDGRCPCRAGRRSPAALR